MVRIAPIGLQYNPRTLWFNPAGHDVKRGDAVIVRTERGMEFGHATDDVMEVDDSALKKLKSPLKPVLRIATEADKAKAAELDQRGRDAMPVFREMAAETNEDMHPVMVEYLFDGDKAVFYFSAEDRVDFRELVRKLASHFHVRVDMRQIGVRDEARIVGGIGHCGQELCCKRMGGEFCPVSIRMAKEQDLSLNPSKISGVCGRLMCCLRYEFEAYKDFKSRAPKVGATIATPDGPAKVSELDVPREIVSLKTEDGKVVKVPLADFEPAEEGARPSAVGAEAYERCSEPEIASGPSIVSFSTPNFTGTDKLSDGSVRLTGRRGSRKTEDARGKKAKSEPSGRKARRRKGSDASSGAASSASQRSKGGGKQPASASHRSRRNRSTSIQTATASDQASTKQPPKQSSKPKDGQKQTGVRPGQNSSGLRAAQYRRKRKPADGAPRQNGKDAKSQQPASKTGGDSHRTARRRSHRAGSNGSSKNAGTEQG